MGDMEFELYHHGVKGQKWGIRRYQNKDGSLIKSGKKHLNDFVAAHNQKVAVKRLEKKSLRTPSSKEIRLMSDDELRKRLNRINLEQSYKEALARQNPKRASKAKQFLSDMADKAARSFTEKAINKLTDRATKYLFDTNDKSEADIATKYRYEDISKLGDKALNKAVKRAEQENKLRNYINSMDGNDVGERKQKKKKKKKND